MTQDTAEGYEKIELYNQQSLELLSNSFKNLITGIHEDPEREGLVKTPMQF